VAERAGHNARVPGKRRVTIPAVPFHEAGFEPGDILRVEADGADRVVLTRVDELVNRYSGCLNTGGDLRDRAKRLREEWPVAPPNMFAYYDPDADIAWFPTGESNDVVNRDPEKFRQAIANDATADDIVAMAHRKEVIARFRELLEDPEAFAEALEAHNGRREAVWQDFLEENPWILGITFAGQLLTSWSEEKLEQVVAGFSVAETGKRTDALLRTNGAIRSLVFAEIKHHEAPLLGAKYRSEAWAVSPELAGGVSQLQQTVYRARHDIGKRLRNTDDEGAETGEVTFLVRPRSYLIIGDLGQLRGANGVHPGKHRSFELPRRNLYEPEIVTFDELLARAEWHVSLAEPSV
jgi:bifunctional DNA-binding transcriptional regulator/antitoxin component of YhaV-PrlF toxin-antitoxin module